MIKNITLGADPELFLKKDNEIISAEGIIGGTKQSPIPISEKGHCIQEDNILIEFNIPPSKSKEDFVDNINTVKDYLEQLVKVKVNGVLDFSASAEIDEKYLQTPQAKLFGCEPDFNVWTKSSNIPPTCNTNLRTCGGHIHIGYDDPTIETNERIVYAMDIILGLESLLLDDDTRRREMYGNAGCFRFRDYGVEYRTLSNFWIENDELIKWAYTSTMKAIQLVNNGLVDDIVSEFGKQIKETIDSNDREQAKKLREKITMKINKKQLVCVDS